MSRQSRKSEQTKTTIVDTAIRLFRQQGYEETTMRQIAEEAGVALGSAYYYFESKEHLVQELYRRMHEEQFEAIRPLLETQTGLKTRLLGVISGILAVLEPYHNITRALFKSAADPSSPLSPFSPQSKTTREKSIAIYEQVIEGSTDKIPKDLGKELPYLLWLYQMAIVLFWIHDRSLFRMKSQKLILHSVDIVVSLVTLASMPAMLPLRKRLLALLADLSGDTNFLSAPAS